MLKSTISIILSLLTYTSFEQSFYSDSIRYTRQLVAIEQQLMNDIPTGETKNWDKYLYKDFFIVTEDGSVLQKEEFLKTFNPLPKGYSGYINVTKPKIVFYGSTAVVQYVSDEYESVYESKIHTLYSSMNTYIKRDTSWIMVSSQVFEIPLLPPPIQLPALTLTKYTGVYALTDSINCIITLESDTLYYQKIGGSKVALLPETENMFFRLSDTRGRKLFSTDVNGVMVMRERRNGQDVIWKRINAAK